MVGVAPKCTHHAVKVEHCCPFQALQEAPLHHPLTSGKESPHRAAHTCTRSHGNADTRISAELHCCYTPEFKARCPKDHGPGVFWAKLLSYRKCCLKLLISQVGLQAYAAAGGACGERDLLAAIMTVRLPILSTHSHPFQDLLTQPAMSS